MSIRQINFTSSLLDNKQKTSVNSSVKQTQISEPKLETTKSETDISLKNKSENHNLRIWSIGLGAAATLISLGVAGRKGYLGKTMQKALGGAKKEVSATSERLSEEVTQTIETGSEQVKVPAGKPIKNEPPVEINSSVEADLTKQEKKLQVHENTVASEPDNIIIKEQEIPQRRAEQKSVQEVEEKAEQKVEQKAEQEVERTVKETTVTELQKAEINAEIDKITTCAVPKIPEEHWFVNPKSLDEFMGDIRIEEDLSKYKTNVYYDFKETLPNGDFVVISRDSGKEVCFIRRCNREGKELYHVKPGSRFRTLEEIMEYGNSHNLKPADAFKYNSDNPIPTMEVRFNGMDYFYENGKLIYIQKYVDKNWYKYDAGGNLIHISYFNGASTCKGVDFSPHTHQPIKIKYYIHNDLFDAAKTEILENGKVVQEIYKIK